ncbi:MAG: hypothetical protein LZF60_130026 [Nitrospira sp.]|nr:MAG: hypothetical protein LZF60_130026 [Nitrospira sp.]
MGPFLSEEIYYMETPFSGAGEWNRTTDLRFTNQARTIFEMLGVSGGFPVFTVNTIACVHSIGSIGSRGTGWF